MLIQNMPTKLHQLPPLTHPVKVDRRPFINPQREVHAARGHGAVEALGVSVGDIVSGIVWVVPSWIINDIRLVGRCGEDVCSFLQPCWPYHTRRPFPPFED